jgi:hypothetical protein
MLKHNDGSGESIVIGEKKGEKSDQQEIKQSSK